jgi:hypothetical protein
MKEECIKPGNMICDYDLGCSECQKCSYYEPEVNFKKIIDFIFPNLKDRLRNFDFWLYVFFAIVGGFMVAVAIYSAIKLVYYLT